MSEPRQELALNKYSEAQAIRGDVDKGETCCLTEAGNDVKNSFSIMSASERMTLVIRTFGRKTFETFPIAVDGQTPLRVLMFVKISQSSEEKRRRRA